MNQRVHNTPLFCPVALKIVEQGAKHVVSLLVKIIFEKFVVIGHVIFVSACELDVIWPVHNTPLFCHYPKKVAEQLVSQVDRNL